MSEPRAPSDPPAPAPEAGQAENFASGPSTPSSAPTERPSPVRDGGRIGPYRLLQKLGEGGMGEVYEAEQESPVRRKVALKVIKAGMDTKQVVARFEAERQALALMSHPSIARVYDGGATPDGHPFFAMEYVKGEPITSYCDRHRLTTRERIEVFRKVCDGVQHAHQKGIIHRDLKPGNVLVQIQDDLPVPKIIDFGVAKATSQKLTEKTMFTQLGMLVGTPEYMSPEQAEMTGLDVDTRTDVYSLGVMLYELLVGALPFDSRELREGGVDEIRRRIREDEPSRPSAKVTTLSGKVSQESASLRRTTTPVLAKELKGDLDWITMRALEKDRTRRYGSPAELAADLGRYLADEPVLAGPPSQAYRMRKFVRRHRLAVTAAGLVLVALLGGLSAASYGMWRALRAERAARQEAAAAEGVSGFLVDLFAVSDPGRARGNTITAREILDQGAARIETDLADQPLVQARLMHTMGIVYRRLGLFSEAIPLLEKATTTRRRMLGDDDPATVSSMQHLGWLYLNLARYDAAEPLIVGAYERRLASLGAENRATLSSMFDLIALYSRLARLQEAEPLAVRAEEICRREFGADDYQTAVAAASLGSVYRQESRDAEAEPLLLEALEIGGRILDEGDPALYSWRKGLAWLRSDQSRYDEAEELFAGVLPADQRIYGDEHPETLDTQSGIAVLHTHTGRYPEAEEEYLRILEVRGRTLGEEHPDTLATKQNLAWLYRQMNRTSDAEDLIVPVLAASRQRFGSRNPRTLSALRDLGWTLVNSEHARAEEAFAEALEGFRAANGDLHKDTLDALNGLAAAIANQGRTEEAEPLYLEALAGREKLQGPDHPRTIAVRQNLSALYLQQQRFEDALPLLEASLASSRHVLGDDHPRTLTAIDRLAWTYVSLGRGREAEALYSEAVERGARVLGEEDPVTLDNLIGLAMLYAGQGRAREAEATVTRLMAIRARRRTRGEADFDLSYNLACLAARLGRRPQALGLLEDAVAEGYTDADWLAQDTDLASLHGDPRFEAVLRKLRANAGGTGR